MGDGMMTFEQLKMLILVSETSSMKAASEILHVTQQNVSKSLIKLERELGIKLFERTSRGTILTLDGKRIYDYAKKIVYYESLINMEAERKLLKKTKPNYIKVLALDTYSLDLEKASEQFATLLPNNYAFIEHTDYIDYQMLIDAEPRFDLILCSLTETDYSMYYEKLKRN